MDLGGSWLELEHVFCGGHDSMAHRCCGQAAAHELGTSGRVCTMANRCPVWALTKSRSSVQPPWQVPTLALLDHEGLWGPTGGSGVMVMTMQQFRAAAAC